MSVDNPILEAKTITQLMAALNKVFGWDFPVSFSTGTVLAGIWKVAISVVAKPKPGVDYVATSTIQSGILENLGGTFVVRVVSSDSTD